jgi:hypothetical protein
MAECIRAEFISKHRTLTTEDFQAIASFIGVAEPIGIATQLHTSHVE